MLLISIVTIGECAERLSSVVTGHFLPELERLSRVEMAMRQLRHHSPTALLFSWVPVIGDLLCVSAGCVRPGKGDSLSLC